MICFLLTECMTWIFDIKNNPHKICEDKLMIGYTCYVVRLSVVSTCSSKSNKQEVTEKQISELFSWNVSFFHNVFKIKDIIRILPILIKILRNFFSLVLYLCRVVCKLFSMIKLNFNRQDIKSLLNKVKNLFLNTF